MFGFSVVPSLAWYLWFSRVFRRYLLPFPDYLSVGFQHIHRTLERPWFSVVFQPPRNQKMISSDQNCRQVFVGVSQLRLVSETCYTVPYEALATPERP